jgi:hypothetical protein
MATGGEQDNGSIALGFPAALHNSAKASAGSDLPPAVDIAVDCTGQEIAAPQIPWRQHSAVNLAKGGDSLVGRGRFHHTLH